MFIVQKSKKRSYGYELHSDKKISWLIDGYTCGWFKNKKDAIKRANELNKSEI